MEDAKKDIKRLYFLGTSIIALILLVISVVLSDEEIVRGNTFYEVRKLNMKLGDAVMNYPEVIGIKDLALMGNINSELRMARDEAILEAGLSNILLLDYEVTYLENDKLSVLYKINADREYLKPVIVNMLTGTRFRNENIIPQAAYRYRDFINLINDKKLSLGIDSDEDLTSINSVYITRSVAGMNIVFIYYYEDVPYKISVSEDELTLLGIYTSLNDTEVDIIGPDIEGTGVVDSKVNILGKDYQLEDALYLSAGHVMIPIEEISKELDYTVEKDGDDKLVVTKGVQTTSIVVGEDSYYFAQIAPFKLGVAVEKMNDKVYVPLEFLKDILKYEVKIEENIVIIEEMKAVEKVNIR